MIDHAPAASARATVFENAEWCVRPDGLEHRATGYFVEAAALGMRRGVTGWEWPLQLAEKSWFRLPAFREAFCAALDAFGIPRDEALALSFAACSDARMGQGASARDGFVALGSLVRPKPVALPRRNTAESRPAILRGTPAPARFPARAQA